MAERSSTDPKTKSDPNIKPAAPSWEKHSEAVSKGQGWYKTTRTLKVKGGTLYQTSTEHRRVGSQGGGIIACSEALVFVPGK